MPRLRRTAPLRSPPVRRIAVVVLVLVAFLAGCSSNAKKAARPATTTTVATPPGLTVARVSSTAAQRIDGFGASGAWWPNDLARFPEQTQKLVAEKLFGPHGIALSGYRYSIGGGGVGVKTPARAPKEFKDDTAGLTFLRAANDAHVPLLTGFVNSAPPQFTTNGKSCGGSLKPGMEDAYAQYLVDIVKHLHDDEHITLQYVSPMNEPDNNFGDCGQEGMSVPVSQRATVVQALGKALADQAPYARSSPTSRPPTRFSPTKHRSGCASRARRNPSPRSRTTPTTSRTTRSARRWSSSHNASASRRG
jgi:hypothetical protein